MNDNEIREKAKKSIDHLLQYQASILLHFVSFKHPDDFKKLGHDKLKNLALLNDLFTFSEPILDGILFELLMNKEAIKRPNFIKTAFEAFSNHKTILDEIRRNLTFEVDCLDNS